MISALHWISRGKSVQHPKKYVLDDSEMDRVSKLANIQFEDAKVQLERAQRDIARAQTGAAAADDDDEWEEEDEEKSQTGDVDMETEDVKTEDPDDLSRYNLDEYDDKPEAEATAGAFSNIRGLAVYQSNEDDPYITVNDNAEGDDEDERQDLEIYPTDNLIIAAKTEDDVSQLEAYLYAASDSNLYVHHDLMLPSFPLCLEWLDYTPAKHADSTADQNSAGQKGNYIAVGTMDPEIEVWSMDVVDGMYPDAILGRKAATNELNVPIGTGKKKRKQTKARVANDEYHVDAVLGLSWNPVARNLLASASADKTVKLWDLSRPHTGDSSTAFRSFNGHTDKVQSVAWQCKAAGGSAASAASPAVLLTGAYDRTIRVFDTRTPEAAAVVKIGSDVESVCWNGWKEGEFLVAMEDGLVQAWDIRAVTQSTWTLQAHDQACTAIDVSPHIPNCLLTASSDRHLKIWNVTDPSTDPDAISAHRSINLTLNRDLGIGKIFAARFSPDDPLTLAVAGSQGQLQVFNALSNLGVRKTFADRLKALPKSQFNLELDGTEPSRGDGIIRLEDDDEDSEDEDTTPMNY